MGDNNTRQTLRFHQELRRSRFREELWKPELARSLAFIYSDGTAEILDAHYLRDIRGVMLVAPRSARWVIFDRWPVKDWVAAIDMLRTRRDQNRMRVTVAPSLDTAIAYIISNYNKWCFTN